MTSKIMLDNLSGASESKIHFIPCDTNTSGAANVKKYFENYIKRDEQHGVTTNALRGYPLIGDTFKVCDTYCGVVLTSSNNDSTTLKISGKFSDLAYWNYDINPSKSDSLQQAMDWMDIAKTLHDDED